MIFELSADAIARFKAAWQCALAEGGTFPAIPLILLERFGPGRRRRRHHKRRLRAERRRRAEFKSQLFFLDDQGVEIPIAEIKSMKVQL